VKSGSVTAGMSKTSTRRSRTILELFVIVTVLCVFGADFCSACLRIPSLATVDEALSKAELSSQNKAKALELRAKLADLLSQGDDRGARALEEQIMDIAGLKLIPVRGCSRWEPKGK